MDLGPLLGLGLFWLVANAIRKGGARPPTGSGRPPGLPPATRPNAPGPGASPRPLPPMPARPDATQREGSALERLLQDLGRTLDEARAAAEPGSDAPASAEAPRAARPSVPSKPGRTKASLASRGGVSSSTTGSDALSAGGGRVEVDQDDEAERVIQRRLEQVAARGGPLGEADHRRFDQQIRQPTAVQAAKRPKEAAMERLRQAVIWREILGPPVSLRDERDV